MFCKACGFIDCVCALRRAHVPGCRLRTAAEGPVGIECDHGHDVCPVCDPCTCEQVKKAMALQGQYDKTGDHRQASASKIVA